MKILHYTLGLPPFRSGGLTKYSVDLMLEQINLGHDISLLYPGAFNPITKQSIKKNKKYYGIQVYEIINPLPVSLLSGIKNPDEYMAKGNKSIYRKFLLALKPNVIHIHTLMGIHKEFFEVASELGIKTIFTSHDYFGLCPKVNLINEEGNICNDFESGQACISCNANGLSFSTVVLMQSNIYRLLKNSKVVKKLRQNKKDKLKVISQQGEKNNIVFTSEVSSEKYSDLRKYYLSIFSLIDQFHFNSSIAKSEYEKYINLNGKVISISHSDIIDKRKTKRFSNSDEPLRLTYLGPNEKFKGFDFLINALEEIRETTEFSWHLSLYGDDRIYSKYHLRYYTFKGRYNYNELEMIFETTDLLIVPSMWKETFGFIGLEGISHGVPIMMSEFVGCKDIITDGETGIIFKANQEDFTDKLKMVLKDRKILEEINQKILNLNYRNTMEAHTKEIVKFYCD